MWINGGCARSIADLSENWISGIFDARINSAIDYGGVSPNRRKFRLQRNPMKSLLYDLDVH